MGLLSSKLVEWLRINYDLRNVFKGVKFWWETLGSHWLGSSNIEQMTRTLNHELLVTLTDDSNHIAHASFRTFSLDDAAAARLRVYDYSGTAGDSLSRHTGKEFQHGSGALNLTCARGLQGMWWHAECGASWLNGMTAAESPMILWNSWRDSVSLSQSQMKMRPEKGLMVWSCCLCVCLLIN